MKSVFGMALAALFVLASLDGAQARFAGGGFSVRIAPVRVAPVRSFSGGARVSTSTKSVAGHRATNTAVAARQGKVAASQRKGWFQMLFVPASAPASCKKVAGAKDKCGPKKPKAI